MARTIGFHRNIQQFRYDRESKFQQLRDSFVRNKPIQKYNGQIFPQEILSKIYTYLLGYEIAKSCELVCKYWRENAQQEHTWKGCALNTNVMSASQLKNIRTPITLPRVELYHRIFHHFPAKMDYIQSYFSKGFSYPECSDEESKLLDLYRSFDEVVRRYYATCSNQIYSSLLTIPIKILALPLYPLYLLLSSRSNASFDEYK
jgi:hypothetical protein